MINNLKQRLTQVVNRNPTDKDRTPFFIVGCVRSGTTILRDVLRNHPRLECPEETHFFRWSDPFGSPMFLRPYQRNEIVRKQQEMDGITPTEFEQLVKLSESRKDLAEGYGRLYLEKKGNPKGRWFDKTPQNLYGILLISNMFPRAKFIHIYRNPLNVVASLFVGKVVHLPNITAATSYWNESMAIMTEYKVLGGSRVLEISYEEFTSKPKESTDAILKFLGEKSEEMRYSDVKIYPERNKFREVLTKEQIREIKRRCAPYFELYGY